MANEGLIIDVDYNITKAEAKQNKLNRQMEISRQKAANITKEIQALNDEIERSKVKEQEYTLEAERLRDRLNKYAKGELDLTDAQVKKESQRYNELVKLIEKEQSHQRSKEKSLATQTLALKKQNAETANIGDQILLNGKKQNKFTKAFDKSTKSAAMFGKKLKSLIASALFFSVVTKAFTALRNEFGKLINETGTKTASLISQINGNLAVIGRTLYESARPAIEAVLQLFVKITNLLANGLAKILGKNVEEMKKLTKQTKKAGKEAKGSLASFDQINTISKPETESDTSSGGNVDFGALNDDIDSNVALLMTLLSGALLVLGVILAFTGINIPLGIGLIIAGAVGLATAVVPNWNDLSDRIQNVIIAILGIVSVALLVLGAIFAFTGNIALGVGFLIAGAVGLATAAGLAMNKLPDDIKNSISMLAAYLGGALLVLGIILLATGVALPLGLGLLIGGAALLAGAVAANWNSMPDNIKNVVSWIMGIGGLLMLVLGIILTCTGNIALGVPLIAIGAVGLVSAVALNWNAIVDKIKPIGNAIKKIFVTVWNGIKDGFKSAVNGIIHYANIWINRLNLILTPIRALIVGISAAFGKEISIDNIKFPTIPKLATGAILPGGSPMLSIVNDQPKGQTYMEGSVDNMVTAFEKALSGRSFGTPVQDNRPIVLQIDSREIARATRTGNESLGNQTVFGGFANAY